MRALAKKTDGPCGHRWTADDLALQPRHFLGCRCTRFRSHEGVCNYCRCGHHIDEHTKEVS